MFELKESLEAQGNELAALKEGHQKLIQANSQASTEQSELRRLNQEGFTVVEAACELATTRVRRLNLPTEAPVLEPQRQSLPLIARFIREWPLISSLSRTRWSPSL